MVKLKNHDKKNIKSSSLIERVNRHKFDTVNMNSIRNSLKFINKENINFCLYSISAALNLKESTYTWSYERKLEVLEDFLIEEKRRGIRLGSIISGLKTTAHYYKKKEDAIRWIDFKNSLQCTFIFMYLACEDDVEISDLLIHEKLSEDKIFYFLSRKEDWRNQGIISMLNEMKSYWAESYIKKSQWFFDEKNLTQLNWIFNYLNKKGALVEGFPLPTDKKTLYEYIFSHLSLIFIDHIDLSDLEPTSTDREDSNVEQELEEYLRGEKFIDNMNKAWLAHVRRSKKLASNQSAIYSQLPKTTAKRLKQLSQKNNLPPEEMIKFLLDTFE